MIEPLLAALAKLRLSLLNVDLGSIIKIDKPSLFNELNLIKIDTLAIAHSPLPNPSIRLLVADQSGTALQFDQDTITSTSTGPQLPPFRTGTHFLFDDASILATLRTPYILTSAALAVAASPDEIVRLNAFDASHREFYLTLEKTTPVSIKAWKPGPATQFDGGIALAANSKWTLKRLKFDHPYAVSSNSAAVLTIAKSFCNRVWHLRRDTEKFTEEYYILVSD
jgi:hypothetical protein